MSETVLFDIRSVNGFTLALRWQLEPIVADTKRLYAERRDGFRHARVQPQFAETYSVQPKSAGATDDQIKLRRK